MQKQNLGQSSGFYLVCFLAVAAQIFTVSVIYADLPRQQATPGGVVIVPIQSIGTNVPLATFHGNSVATVKVGEQWNAVVGIPLDKKAGSYQLVVRWGKGGPKAQYPISIKNKEYPTQYLTIKNKRQVNPNPEDLKRIQKDSLRIKKARNHWSDSRPSFSFSMPVVGRKSSAFGLRRYFNKQARKPHGGMDIAAVQGTSILAPADGVVIETGDYFFSGKCIFIDHGRGLITFYAHLHRIAVEVGQAVRRSEKIGEVGQSGRVTGSHLHWSVGLNGTWVNPELFISQ